MRSVKATSHGDIFFVNLGKVFWWILVDHKLLVHCILKKQHNFILAWPGVKLMISGIKTRKYIHIMTKLISDYATSYSAIYI